jgi:hypothetical protein
LAAVRAERDRPDVQRMPRERSQQAALIGIP